MLRPTAMPCCRKALGWSCGSTSSRSSDPQRSRAASALGSRRRLPAFFFDPRPSRARLADAVDQHLAREQLLPTLGHGPGGRQSSLRRLGPIGGLRRQRSSHNAATSTIAAFTSSDTPAGATSGSINLPSSAARAASCRRRIAASVEQYRYPCETRSRETRPCCVNRSNDSFAPTWSNASSSLEKYPRSASRMHCSKVAIKVPCFENHTDRADHKPCWSNSMSSFKA